VAIVRPHHGIAPHVPVTAFLAETAVVIGEVTLGERVSVWYHAVIRGDVHWIRIGDRTNVQDGTVIHVTNGRHPTDIANDVVIGHMAMIHGARIRERCLIGMASVLLDDCEIGAESIVAAGSLVPPGMIVPPRSLVMGRPARRVRDVTDDEVESMILAGVRNYLAYQETYRSPD
jgi:carbonic anhydrase/acetyltransferase-like protein (isoleucine patch superfamily)